MKTRLVTALALYAALAIITAWTLDGYLRSALLFFFGALAVKTFIHSRQDE